MSEERWSDARVLTLLGEYSCGFRLFGNWPNQTTWEQVAWNLESINGFNNDWWRVWWRMRDRNCSATLWWGEITQGPPLYDFRDWPVNPNDLRTYRQTAAIVHNRYHVHCDVTRLQERQTVLIHELIHVAYFSCDLDGPDGKGLPELQEEHNRLVASGELTGVEQESLTEWFATAGERFMAGQPYPGGPFVYDVLARFR